MRSVQASKKGIGKVPGLSARVIKTVVKAPLRLAAVPRSVVKTPRTQPQPGEEPVVVLRVQVIGCRELVARDKGGTSDPFVVVSLAKRSFNTPSVKKTLNPEYDAKDATFDIPIFASLAEVSSNLELLIWDKDMLSKEYLGEATISVEEWFKEGVVGFDDPKNTPVSLPIVSTRTKAKVSGTIQIKVGFVKSATSSSSQTVDEIYTDLVSRSLTAAPTLLSAPPTRGIGTVRSRLGPPEELGEQSDLEDDGMSSEDDVETDDEFFDAENNSSAFPPSTTAGATLGVEPARLSTIMASPDVLPSSQSSSQLMTPTPSSGGRLPRLFSSRGSPKHYRDSTSTPGTPGTSGEGLDYLTAKPAKESSSRSGSITPGGTRILRPRFKKRETSGYNFDTSHDIKGIVLLEISSAADLPKVRNLTRLSWDMDPFVVVSFSRKVFRTRVVRHSLNPQWDEKLLFHVRKHEEQYNVKFAVLDWDKLSGNDQIAEANLTLSELMKNAPKPDPKTGLYAEGVETPQDMMELTLPLGGLRESIWESKHSPTLTIRAKYQPYDALRQRFWRQYLKQYDTDETGTYSRIELRSMLDSLGSTLTKSTLDEFFTHNNKNPETDDLTLDETIIALEQAMARPTSEKNTVTPGDVSGSQTGSATPNLNFNDFPSVDGVSQQLELTGLDAPSEKAADLANHGEPQPEAFRESNQRVLPGQGPTATTPSKESLAPPTDDVTPGPIGTLPVTGEANRTSMISVESSASDVDLSMLPTPDSGAGVDTSVERVINIKICPLCHKPRVSNRAETDMVTHLAVCASSDWNRVNRLVVGNYVTASQAQRKWYTNVVTKVSSGAYQLGANSANIIVQNRMTGQLEEEKMQAFVRLGIRLLYKGASGRLEGKKARKLLKSMSIKQGIKYDSPESAREIPSFIDFHKLNMNEVLDPVESFKTFNQFFYRKLKPEARPAASPDDPRVLVSGADCRMMAFDTVTQATKLWIKGRDFTVAKLIGPAYANEASRYDGGSLCIFRLAPQDYHRFHSPVDGTIGKMTYVSGEYYTVNPQAVRSPLDIYGENARKIVPIDSPVFGRVFAVCVGAMMVGSILTTVNEGDTVARGQEFGYFAFGGSTIVVLFEKGRVQFDEDLLINGQACLETLVRVGMQIGKSPRTSPN